MSRPPRPRGRRRAANRVDDLIQMLREALPPKGLGLAVSGGSDSLAMLILAAEAGLRPAVATVDHGLRAEAPAEAAMVAAACARLGLSHTTLHWHWDRKGNLQDAARRGRRALLAGWAAERGLCVALAHTQDDCAETFLMRLTRGAGVDGLAAMATRFQDDGVTFLRPLLSVPRQRLRQALTARGIPWAEDPSNADPAYHRARLRAAQPGLDALGLSADRLATSAGHLIMARQALDTLADLWSPRAIAEDRGTLLFRDAFWQAPEETRRRLLIRALMWLAPAPYAPRGPSLDRLLAQLQAGKAATLSGVRFHPGRAGLRAWREARSLPPPVPAEALWDGRWTARAPQGAVIGPLGPSDLPSDLPRAALASSPAIWLDHRVIAAPCAGLHHEAVELRSILPAFGPLTAALSH